jgi:hypothetical protein
MAREKERQKTQRRAAQRKKLKGARRKEKGS